MKNSTRQLTDQEVDPNEDFRKIASRKLHISTLTISNTTSDDAGNYTCLAINEKINVSKTANLDLSFEAKLLNKNDTIKKNSTVLQNITLTCEFEG